MKVKSVEIWDTTCNDAPSWNPVLIRVNTDEGISGVGEVGVAYGIGHSAAAGCVKDLQSNFCSAMIRLKPKCSGLKYSGNRFGARGGGPIIYGRNERRRYGPMGHQG